MRQVSEKSNIEKELSEFWPEITNPAVREIIKKVEMLRDLQLRSKKSGASRADWVNAARVLLGLNRKELIYLLLSLGQNEFPSIFPYSITLMKRKDTTYDKGRLKSLKKAEKKDKKIKDQETTVAIITKYSSEKRENITNSIIDLGLSGSFGPKGHKHPSEAKLRKDYNAGLGTARERGYAELHNLNAMAPREKITVGPSRRGRPKKDKKPRS
jgi:hypothetical protein